MKKKIIAGVCLALVAVVAGLVIWKTAAGNR